MKRKIFTVLIMLGILLLFGACAGTKSATVSVSPAKASTAKAAPLSLPVAKGSKVVYDDKIGFEEFSFIMDENNLTTIEGDIRRIFTQDPEGKSPLAMIRHYEEAIKNMGGGILFKTRTPKEEEMGGEKLTELFKTHRVDRGLSTDVFTYTHFPNGNEKEGITEFLSAVVKKGTSEMHVYVASGKGAWAANTLDNTYTEIVTVNK